MDQSSARSVEMADVLAQFTRTPFRDHVPNCWWKGLLATAIRNPGKAPLDDRFALFVIQRR
jgi:hypothetical protein